MQVVNAQLIEGKTVLLRLDLDVALSPATTPTTHQTESGQIVTSNLVVAEPYRLEAGFETLKLCLDHAKSVIVMGHIGRPEGKEVPELSIAPIVDWIETKLGNTELPEGKLHILENLRFEAGEDAADLEFAKELAQMGDFFVNEAFASHRPAASTTVLASLLPHAAGLRFAKEVEVLNHVIKEPKKPLVAVIGGAKVEDKLAVVESLAKVADAVLLGGKLLHEIREKNMTFPNNVQVGRLSDDGFDLAPETIMLFQGIISRAAQVIWSGPLGKFEDGHNAGNRAVAGAITYSGADSIVGGGDTIACLISIQMLDKMKFVSTGGGAMLKLLAGGTLPTIESLN